MKTMIKFTYRNGLIKTIELPSDRFAVQKSLVEKLRHSTFLTLESDTVLMVKVEDVIQIEIFDIDEN